MDGGCVSGIPCCWLGQPTQLPFGPCSRVRHSPECHVPDSGGAKAGEPWRDALLIQPTGQVAKEGLPGGERERERGRADKWAKKQAHGGCLARGNGEGNSERRVQTPDNGYLCWTNPVAVPADGVRVGAAVKLHI